jgi:pyrroloquinoline-quinone synthase
MLKTELDQRIQKWELLKHPFYQAWESGKLPVEALATYAREYGAFISELPAGWSVLLDEETANEEREHTALWSKFAESLHTEANQPTLPAIKRLVSGARQHFATPETALGALYAFESQQPDTAISKLDGLRKHYQLGKAAEPYFELHSKNQHEAAKLLAGISELSEPHKQDALNACEQMSQAMWDALTDIYNHHCLN